jgi:hypothetical protein
MSDNPKALTPAPPRKPPTLTRVNRQGLIEIIDLTTGKVLCVQRQPGDDFLQAKFDNLTRIETPEGPVWIEKGIDPSRVALSPKIAYSPAWADLIAEKMVNGVEEGKGGASLLKACQSVGLPYSLVCRWRREFSEFRAIIDEARKDRAEAFHDEIVDTARVQAEGDKHAKVHIDALKWAAEKGDPEKFGSKTKLQLDSNAPVAFLIDTGIRRKGDQGHIAQNMPDGIDDLQSEVIDVQPREVAEPPSDLGVKGSGPEDSSQMTGLASHVATAHTETVSIVTASIAPGEKDGLPVEDYPPRQEEPLAKIDPE